MSFLACHRPRPSGTEAAPLNGRLGEHVAGEAIMARILIIAIALTLPALSGVAWAIPEDSHDDYLAGDFGRIRYEEHGVSVVRGTESNPGPTAEAS